MKATDHSGLLSNSYQRLSELYGGHFIDHRDSEVLDRIVIDLTTHQNQSQSFTDWILSCHRHSVPVFRLDVFPTLAMCRRGLGRDVLVEEIGILNRRLVHLLKVSCRDRLIRFSIVIPSILILAGFILCACSMARVNDSDNYTLFLVAILLIVIGGVCTVSGCASVGCATRQKLKFAVNDMKRYVNVGLNGIYEPRGIHWQFVQDRCPQQEGSRYYDHDLDPPVGSGLSMKHYHVVVECMEPIEFTGLSRSL